MSSEFGSKVSLPLIIKIILRENLLCYLHYSDLQSVPSSVESNSQSTKDSSEFAAPDDLQSASRDDGETPGTIQTNDVASDTPLSH